MTVTLVHPERGESVVNVHGGRCVIRPVHDGRRSGDEFYEFVAPDRAVYARTEWMPWLPLPEGVPDVFCLACGSTSDTPPSFSDKAAFYIDNCPNCRVKQ